MGFKQIENRAISTLLTGVTDVGATWTLAAGEGALFPSSGEFNVTCEDEIVICTSRTADVLTVTRATESTTAVAHAAGRAVELRITKAVMEQCQSPRTVTFAVAASDAPAQSLAPTDYSCDGTDDYVEIQEALDAI